MISLSRLFGLFGLSGKDKNYGLLQSIRTMDHFVKRLRLRDPIHQKDEIDQTDLLFFLTTSARPSAEDNERTDSQGK